MFKSAVIKLTAWYLLIIMVISLCFTLALFSVTNNDVQANLRRQGQDFMRFGITANQFEQARVIALRDLQRREILNLLRFNIFVLAFGGGASYFLARRTLSPLETAMEAQARFTGDASHELRTPLTAMRSEIEVALREQKLSATDSRDLLKSNLEEVIKLQELSQSLLQLAGYSGKNGTLEFSELDIAEPLKTAIDRVIKQAEARSMHIDVVSRHLTLIGNSPSIVELFVTLLDNAIKYGYENGTISVAVRTNAREAIITVQDDGIGIAHADIPFIFDRFYRAESSRSKGITEGYGLGLSLASQIVSAHQGSIQVDSAEGHGSLFTIKLPLVRHQSFPNFLSFIQKRD
jgi:signal transduction histidine kinase